MDVELDFIRSMPPVRASDASADQQNAASAAARGALVPYAGPTGVVMHDNGEWLVTAHR